MEGLFTPRVTRGVKRFFLTKEILERELQANTYIAIGKKYGVNHGSVRWAAQKYGIQKMSRFWSPEEVRRIGELYAAGASLQELSTWRSLSAVQHKASRLGIKRREGKRKYRLNRDFFKKWTPQMAYVFGWLCSDGYVTKKKLAISLHLQRRDGYILELIKRCMQTNCAIFDDGKYVNLRINSKLLVADVVALGCTNNKSWTLKLSNVPRNVLSHFVRGYFDGDGSIMFNRPNTIKISFFGSEVFLISLRSKLNQALGIKYNKIVLGNIYTLYYYGDDARKICSWMYRGAEDLYLVRKRERFINHMRIRNGVQASPSAAYGSETQNR